ncbi:MAG TPA: hypothetical protein DF383_04645, partial [Deltaproteobacteria bacterium]|nr:hypothetical protein [Deltaproteobacteria bacterium]
ILGRLEAEMIAQKLPVPEILLRRQSRRLRAQVSEWLEAEQEVWKKAERKLFPRHLEWRFGNSPDSLLRYPLEPNLSIPFSGAVDRIDVSENGENYLLIDYKSSGSALLAKGIREGRRLQLWIYRQAVEQLLYPQKEALGGLYWDFKEMKRDQGMVRRQAYQAFVPKKIHAAAKSFLQDEEYEELETQLQNALQSILSKIVAGDYSLKPRECLGDSCSFSEICRYDSKPSR